MFTLPAERKQKILECLYQDGKVNVVHLSDLFDVSTETIRRDLDLLEKEGLLKRVYGGAVKINYQSGEPPFLQRQNMNLQAKQAIAREAVKLIKDGDTIAMDVGTTTLEMARAIRGFSHLTVLTNSLPLCSVLLDSINQGFFYGKVILLGGEVNSQQYSISGSLCEQLLDFFHVDKAFISVGGMALSSGISDYDIGEAMLSKKMIHQANEAIVLADSSKIGVQGLCKIASFDEVDVLICEQEKPVAWEKDLSKSEILWITAK